MQELARAFLKIPSVFKNIKIMCLVVAEPGIRAVEAVHPDVHIYTVGYDKELNENGYITPGLGDAGDRLFGTK